MSINLRAVHIPDGQPRTFKPGDAVHWCMTTTVISGRGVRCSNKSQHGTVMEVDGAQVIVTYGKSKPKRLRVDAVDLRHKGERDAFTEAFLKAFGDEAQPAAAP